MRIRSFIALCFPVLSTRRIAEEVERHQAGLQKAGLRIAWVPPANFHVTLKFLGSVEEELLEGVAERLQKVARRPPLEARVACLGAFPSTIEPKVLWVGVDGGEPLLALAAQLEAEMVELGLEREERLFHPHITVGRVKSQPPGGDASDLWRSEVDLGGVRLSEVVVYESKSHAAGSEYIARVRVPFSNTRESDDGLG
jgi:2'-5' RNA ligase